MIGANLIVVRKIKSDQFNHWNQPFVAPLKTTAQNRPICPINGHAQEDSA
jgi:hypothetical protein